jgi:hypothetical protein
MLTIEYSWKPAVSISIGDLVPDPYGATRILVDGDEVGWLFGVAGTDHFQVLEIKGKSAAELLHRLRLKLNHPRRLDSGSEYSKYLDALGYVESILNPVGD